MRFVKMHGIGNDYVYLDAYTDPGLELRDDLPGLAKRMSDRHSGVGSDGLILVCRPRAEGRGPGRGPGAPDEAAPHARMRMFNADGSESEMCGNGVRCVAKFVHDRLGVRENPLRIQTGRGLLSISYDTADGRLAMATVDMGEPILAPAEVPVDLSGLTPDVLRAARPSAPKGENPAPPPAPRGRPVSGTIRTPSGDWFATFVSMGNPHAVIFGQGGQPLTPELLRALDLDRLGPQVERHPAFPRRINAHWVAVRSPGEATMRTWERGAGVTLACGTGACAVVVAGAARGLLGRSVMLHLPGGDLYIRWDEATNRLFKTGPATEVFEGEWPE